jgi:hypothetical protein
MAQRHIGAEAQWLSRAMAQRYRVQKRRGAMAQRPVINQVLLALISFVSMTEMILQLSIN